MNVKYLSDYFGLTAWFASLAAWLLMYRRILVALENGPADESLLPHVAELALQSSAPSCCSSTSRTAGWRVNYDQLKLAESEEMKADRDIPRDRPPALRRDRAWRSHSIWRWATRRPRF